MSNKLKVFISSTADLVDLRKKTAKILLELKIEDNKFEDWSSSPKNPIEECITQVKESDALILLIGKEYGTILDNGKSVTYLEYETAKTCSIPIFAYLLPESELGDNNVKNFIKDINKTVYRSTVTSLNDLEFNIQESFNNEFVRCFKEINKPTFENTKRTINETYTDIGELPIEKTELYKYLQIKYNNGEDEYIHNVSDKIIKTISNDKEILNIIYMSEVNLGINNYQVNINLVNNAIHLWTELSKNIKYNDYLYSINYNLGNAYQIFKDYTTAINYYKQSIDLEQNNPACLKNLGSIYFELSEYDKYYNYTKKALELDPNLIEANLSMGIYYISILNEYDKGIYYLNIIENTTNIFFKDKILSWKSFALLKQKKYHEAIKILKTIKEEDDNNWIINNLNNCYYNLVRIDNSRKSEAIEHWKAYINNFDNDMDAYYELGELYYSYGFQINSTDNFEQAIYYYKKAIEYKYNDKTGILWDHLGHSYEYIDDYEKAYNSFKNAILRNQKQYTYCLVALLLKLEIYNEALPLALKDAKYFHKDSRSWYQVAICYIKLNDFNNSKKCLIKSIKLDKKYPFPLYELGGLYWNYSFNKKALKIWKKAIKIFPDFERFNEVSELLSNL